MRLNVEHAKERAAEGLKDGGHVLVSCSNCRAILMDIWRTRPHEPQVWKVKATCPFCGDASFICEIQGGFHPGGYGAVKPDNPDDDVPSTAIAGSDIVDGVIIFNINKASEHAKPIRAK